MKKLKSHIISSPELKKKLKSKFLKIIDCRYYINDPNKGFEEYKKNHIPGALFFDLEKHSNKSLNTPHMLPTKSQFLKFVANYRISLNDLIIIYDQTGFFSSARIWFTFIFFNFKRVKILNGGIKLWNDRGFPLTRNRELFLEKNNGAKIIKGLKQIKEKVVNKSFVKKSINCEKTIIIDARPKNRFFGIEPEPRRQIKKGNIEGSINIPFTKIIDKKGKLLSINKLKIMFEKEIDFSRFNQIICSCGSGITACNIIFALNLLGVKNIKLYDGSWAEWGKK